MAPPSVSVLAPASTREPATPYKPASVWPDAADRSSVAPLPMSEMAEAADSRPAPLSTSVPPLIVVAPV